MGFTLELVSFLMMFDVWISNLHHHLIRHRHNHFLPLHFHLHPNWKKEEIISLERLIIELLTEHDQEQIHRHSSHQLHRNLHLDHNHYVSLLAVLLHLDRNPLNNGKYQINDDVFDGYLPKSRSISSPSSPASIIASFNFLS